MAQEAHLCEYQAYGVTVEGDGVLVCNKGGNRCGSCKHLLDCHVLSRSPWGVLNMCHQRWPVSFAGVDGSFLGLRLAP